MRSHVRLTHIVLSVAVALFLAGRANTEPLVLLEERGQWTQWEAGDVWQWQQEWVGGSGANTWQYAKCGSAEWQDYAVDFALRIDEASARRGPKWEGGGWVWAAYRNNYYKQAPYSIDFRPRGKRMFVRGAVAKGVWTHLGVVDDGKTVKLYANGALAREEAIGGANWAAIAGPLVLGTRLSHGDPTLGFKGRLADCAYWNRALTAAEVEALFKGGPR